MYNEGITYSGTAAANRSSVSSQIESLDFSEPTGHYKSYVAGVQVATKKAPGRLQMRARGCLTVSASEPDPCMTLEYVVDVECEVHAAL